MLYLLMQRMTLDSLVPPWLTSTCPNMTSLKLQHCVCSGLPVPSPECNHLKELELVSMFSPEQEAGQLRNQTGP